MNELELYNPELDELDDDEEGDFQLVEVAEKPKKRRKRKNPEPVVVATPILLLIAGYLGWCAYSKSKTGSWSFTPWKLAVKPIQLRQTNNAQAEEERRRAEFHRHVEQATKPTVYSVEEIDIWKKPTYRPVTEETVSFIYP